MAMQEEILKRLQGLKDARSQIGELARGKNMYPGGGPAQSGPGGPDMGRPPEMKIVDDSGLRPSVGPAAVQAVQNQVAANPVPSQVAAPAPGIAEAQQRIQQAMQNNSMQNVMQQRDMNAAKSSLQAANQRSMLSNRKASDLAKSALQAAAKRRMKR